MLFCKGSSLSPSSKAVFLQNLFALPEIFPSLFSPTQHLLPFSSIISHLYRGSPILKNYKGNLCEPIRKSTMNRYASTNSRFTTCQENYVTIGASNAQTNRHIIIWKRTISSFPYNLVIRLGNLDQWNFNLLELFLTLHYKISLLSNYNSIQVTTDQCISSLQLFFPIFFILIMGNLGATGKVVAMSQTHHHHLQCHKFIVITCNATDTLNTIKSRYVEISNRRKWH